MQELWATKAQSAMENLGFRAGGDHLVSTTGRRKDGPSPRPSPIGWQRGKTRWQQGRARPLTAALSPSDGEREKRDGAAAGGADKMRRSVTNAKGGDGQPVETGRELRLVI